MDCPRVCPNCPLQPAGVKVELADVKPWGASMNTVVMTVVEADDSSQLGKELKMLVDTSDGGIWQVKRAIEACSGPIHNWLQRIALRFRIRVVGRCGAVNNSNIKWR